MTYATHEPTNPRTAELTNRRTHELHLTHDSASVTSFTIAGAESAASPW
jgi:hypothetical protein